MTEMCFVEERNAEEGNLKVRVIRSMFYWTPATGKMCTRKWLTGNIVNLGSRACLLRTDIEKPCNIILFHKTEWHSALLTKSLKK